MNYLASFQKPHSNLVTDLFSFIRRAGRTIVDSYFLSIHCSRSTAVVSGRRVNLITFPSKDESATHDIWVDTRVIGSINAAVVVAEFNVKLKLCPRCLCSR